MTHNPILRTYPLIPLKKGSTIEGKALGEASPARPPYEPSEGSPSLRPTEKKEGDDDLGVSVVRVFGTASGFI